MRDLAALGEKLKGGPHEEGISAGALFYETGEFEMLDAPVICLK